MDTDVVPAATWKPAASLSSAALKPLQPNSLRPGWHPSTTRHAHPSVLLKLARRGRAEERQVVDVGKDPLSQIGGRDREVNVLPRVGNLLRSLKELTGQREGELEATIGTDAVRWAQQPTTT